MLKKIYKSIKYINQHPFAQSRRNKAISNYIIWQISSRLKGLPSLIPWINDTYFIAKNGMTGATGNIYVGLHDFSDMSFLLHLLRPRDSFIDVGANIGSYTILAGGAIGATCYSFEPSPETYKWLKRNVGVNLMNENVFLFNMGVAAEKGELFFSKGLDTVNHIVRSSTFCKSQTTIIKVDILDNLVKSSPILMKIDVEGFEQEVLLGGNRHLNSKELKAIIIELNGSGKRYGYKDNDINQLLLNQGFKAFNYDPFERELTALESYGNYNTIFIRDVDFVQERLKAAPRFNIWGEAI